MTETVRVHTDFEGASLEVDRIASASLRARLREEAICYADGAVYDYNRHFAFGIENLGSAPVTADVLINCQSANGMPEGTSLLFESPSPNQVFVNSPLAARSDGRKAYAIKVPLQPRETKYLANYLFRPYSTLGPLFDRLASAGNASRHVIGQSLESRDLVAYSYCERPPRDVPRPAILITSGVHPPEPDTLATEAIMEHLASPAGAATRALFDIHIVPVMNPDGFVHGYNGCNAAQINFYWTFDPRDRVRCPEAHWLWHFIERHVPVVYFDWHGYTFQRGAKHAAPYVKPVLLHDGRSVRRIVSRLNRRVQDIAGGHATTGFLTYAPSTLGTQLTLVFNTITYAKYHLELRLGIDRNKQLAVDSLTAVADELRSAGALDPRTILKRPYGDVRPDVVGTIGRSFVFWWGGRARPALGRLKRRLNGNRRQVGVAPA